MQTLRPLPGAEAGARWSGAMLCIACMAMSTWMTWTHVARIDPCPGQQGRRNILLSDEHGLAYKNVPKPKLCCLNHNRADLSLDQFPDSQV